MDWNELSVTTTTTKKCITHDERKSYYEIKKN